MKALDALLQTPGLWRGNACAETAQPSVPSGYAVLDEQLPGGGWPTGALTEILLEHPGVGELRLLLPALARLSSEDRWLAWVAPPYIPYPPALAAAGLKMERLLWLRPDNHTDALWALEQALRSGACSAVLGWPATLDGKALRRLQLAAEEGRAVSLLFRPLRTAANASTAALRLALEPADGRLKIRILKRRGGNVSAPLLLDLPARTRGKNGESIGTAQASPAGGGMRAARAGKLRLVPHH
ncbi:translesion DNA synthesis-associated protein ImuA [Methylogaea oryzae]|uniref:Translesion DNA synthesis-associated protein ImuA n=1 Tax=Methylogaea oryzae TaxID=1295382 RepID=A0A8D4VPQ7_9GAMM|nr:translesion DNA synthesis-associated protein ImuA [Methylogaea oryzae]BBL71780.1 hypothetical protein MoryE10_23860 [Methylogaea oryzae]